MKKKLYSYVLITPAYNEEENIEKTIQSVIRQTILPYRWVIVSDRSTDGTDDIIKKYCRKHKWILFHRISEHPNRQFAAKVFCFNAGYKELNGINYYIIGNLDGDISFEPDYFEFLLSKFMENPELGVASTPYIEKDFQSYKHRFSNFNNVSGGCQLFRRECFEAVGGYIPNERGGIDWIATTTARMKGWTTRTFLEKTYFHHRPVGTGNATLLGSKFKHGQKDYYLGGHPLWQIFRAFFQMKHKPYIAGGIFLLLGYISAYIQGIEKPVSSELQRFHRKEQIQRLKKIIFRL